MLFGQTIYKVENISIEYCQKNIYLTLFALILFLKNISLEVNIFSSFVLERIILSKFEF